MKNGVNFCAPFFKMVSKVAACQSSQVFLFLQVAISDKVYVDTFKKHLRKLYYEV